MSPELKAEKLRYLLQDTALLQAILEVFNITVEDHRPSVSENTPNETVGQEYRAYERAKSIVASAFGKLEDYREEGGDKPLDDRHL